MRKGKKISRKETRKIVFMKLSAAMAEYKETLKDKKVVSNLKKVSKIFASDIVKAARQDQKIQKTNTKVKAQKTETEKELKKMA